ncbi:MAG: hypothetical protein JSR86_12780 [Proteobacteria bacterium]|nr:hypothetical protein [Pseudomonadota bacterium]
MSCDAVAAAAFIWLASTSPVNTSHGLTLAAAEAPPPSVAGEPLFIDIVARARKLKAETEGFLKDDLSGAADTLPDYAGFKARVAQLSDLDMQGHVTLAQRGAKDDLKCILRGISQDLPVRIKDLEAAATPKARTDALKEMTYLLRDNVEVITAPPQPAA